MDTLTRIIALETDRDEMLKENRILKGMLIRMHGEVGHKFVADKDGWLRCWCGVIDDQRVPVADECNPSMGMDTL